jgi:hypothetical protein
MAIVPPLKLTRDQLASFLQDFEQIKQFENLFATVQTLAPIVGTDFEYQADNAAASANEALAQIAALQRIVQLLANAPTIENNNSLKTDYLDLNQSAPHVSRIRRLAWNDSEKTAELGMDYGVVQQIGLEYYARVENTTGITIPNGSVVGFAGVGANNTLAVAPYLADGSTPTLYILGVMTHDLPNSGEIGYATVWGHVRGIDTSAFSVGDILYASPTTPGGFTNVKPTAPDNVIPVAAVLASDATNGEIFVRPTIEQQKFYGVFSYNGVDQSIAATYTPQAVLFDTTDIADGISIGSPASRIVVAESGLYKFDFSMQIESNSSSAKKLWIWPRIDGSDVPNSNSEVTFSGSGTVLVPSWSWTLSLTAGQYFQIMIAGDSTDIDVTSKAAQTGANGTAAFARPAVPGIILEVTEVQQ